MKWNKVKFWETGRQKTGYKKLKLWLFDNSDCWLIYYPKGAYIPKHTDPIKDKHHYRLNIRLLGPDNFKGQTIFKIGNVCFFRPDIMEHSVEKVDRKRIILSLGFAV